MKAYKPDSETLMSVGSYKVQAMTEISEILSNKGDLDIDVADKIREELEENIELPQGLEFEEPGPTISADDTGDWIVAEIEITPNKFAEVYALEGAFTLQLYDGEEFKEPTTSVDELSEQLAEIK